MSAEESDKETLKVAAKALVAAVESFDGDKDSFHSRCDPLLKLFRGDDGRLSEDFTDKQQESKLLDAFRSHNKAFVHRFFGGVRDTIELILSEEAYVPESAFEHDTEDTRDSESKEANDLRAKTCLEYLRCTAMCANASLEGRIEQRRSRDGPSTVQVAPEIFDVAVQLHSALLSIHDCGEEGLPTRNTILALCEAWWLGNVVNRDSLIAQVLPLLVLQASDPTEFQKSHIKKLLYFKDAFLVIDFLNPSSNSLRALLLRVASNPLCLKLAEGRKFLASLFRDPDLVTDLHLAFRAQVPNASKTVLHAYGEIYFKSWCDAEDSAEEEAKETIEHQALQDLMHSSIHLAKPAMVKNVLTILAPIHMEKKSTRVADLLWRLYSPILWRSLSAANPIVRKNAITVLEQVFPLHNPKEGQMKVAIQKCTQAIKKALQDGDPKVRVAASEATSNICALFWEALPSADLRMLLNQIIMEHSSDVASAGVRAQALVTTANLLEIPQSHAVLRPLLPSLGNLIHDKTEKVRLAAVKLLRRIKQTRGIHFYHVVPVEHLSARFSEEEAAHRDRKNIVNKELTALMLSSYFPQGENITVGDQIQRTMAFLVNDPAAASSFYANLVHFLDVEAISKFVAVLLACLKSATQSDQAEQVKRTGRQKKRNRGNGTADGDTDDPNKGLSASNTELMDGLTETILTLLQSISHLLDIPENEPSKKLVQSRLQEAELLNALAHFEQKAMDGQLTSSTERDRSAKNFRVCGAILQIIALVPKDTIPGAWKFAMESLRTIAHSDSISSSHGLSHILLLAKWGMVESIASELARAVKSGVSDCLSLTLASPDFRSGVVGKKRSKSFDPSLPEFSSRFAFDILQHILSGNKSAALSVREMILASEKATKDLASGLGQAMKHVEHLFSSQSVMEQPLREVNQNLLLGCFEAYGRFTLHLACHDETKEPGVELEKIIDWANEYLLPMLCGSEAPADTALHGLDLSRISSSSDSMVMESPLGMMSPPKQRVNRCRQSRPSSTAAQGFLPSTGSIENLAQLLMQSIVLVVSEFVHVGGNLDDHIIEKLSSWFSVFAEQLDAERARKMKAQLLPSFVRLSLQLSKKANDFTLLRQLFMTCGSRVDDGTPTEMLTQTVKSLLPNGLQKDSPFMADLSEALLSVGASFSHDIDGEFQAITEASDVLPSSSVGLALETCAANPKACHFLADRVLSKLLHHRGQANHEVLFNGRCLSYLVSTMQSDTYNEKLVEEISVERSQFDEVRNMLNKIVYVGAQ